MCCFIFFSIFSRSYNYNSSKTPLKSLTGVSEKNLLILPSKSGNSSQDEFQKTDEIVAEHWDPREVCMPVLPPLLYSDLLNKDYKRDLRKRKKLKM